LAAESAADTDAARIARILYEKGLESFLAVFDAERASTQPTTGSRRASATPVRRSLLCISHWAAAGRHAG
jgi:hypothetical protein